LTVVLHHLLNPILDSVSIQVLQSGRLARLLLWLPVCSRLAVAVFIVISGFCLALPVIRNDGELVGGVVGFFRKRGRRVLPAYYAAVLLALLLLPTQAGAWDVFLHLFLLQNLSAEWVGRINGVFWSLAVEWQVYLCFPLLVWSWRRFGAMRVVSVLLPLAIVGLVTSENSAWFWLKPHFHLLFVLGMLAAALTFLPQSHWRMARTSIPWGALSASLAVTLALCVVSHGCRVVHDHINHFELLTGLAAFALLVTLSGSAPNRLRRLLEWKPVVAVGGFSYSIYLIHPVFVYQIGRLFRPYVWLPFHLSAGSAYVLLALVAMPIILVASYLFHLAFERPSLHGAHRQRRDPSETTLPSRWVEVNQRRYHPSQPFL
jgi:peptidoglycan/LPS O-acetylase OafA/YrhL